MKKQILSILEGNKTNLSSRQFVGRDLPHPLLLGQEEKQPCFTRDVEDPRQRPSGMTPVFYNDNSMGFTLIELLVVVLIIGILASVALPQYQFSVDKTRAMTHYQNIQAIIKTEQVYKMANGNYTGDFELLDVDWTKTCTLIGADHRELANCSGGFGFQMANPAAVPTEIWLRWCKEANSVCSSDYTNYHLLVKFSMTDGSVIDCTSKTTRGQKLCNYFTQQFGNTAS